MPSDQSGKGGIDLRALPIVTQPAPSISKEQLSPALSNAQKLSPDELERLNQDWSEIQNMISAGIIPSCERLRDYVNKACFAQDCSSRIDTVLNSMADIFRLEEDSVSPTDPVLRQMLVLLESNKPVNDLPAALTQIEAKDALN
jgi:hypothetical protein